MSRIAPVYRYVAIVSVIGCAVFAGLLVVSFRPSEYASPHFWALALATVVAELFPIHFTIRKEAVTISPSGAYAFALLVSHGIGPAAVAFVAALVIDEVRHRKTWWKIIFNSAQYTLSLAAGALVLEVLTDLPRAGGVFKMTELPAMMVGGAAFFVVNSLLTAVGIALAEGSDIKATVRSNIRVIAVTDSLLLPLTPVVIAVANYSLWLLPLLALPMIAAYRSGTISLKNIELAENLGLLYEATRMTYGQQKFEDSVSSLLSQACSMFRAESASFILLGGEDAPHLETTFTVDGEFSFLQPVRLDPTKGVWARVIAEDSALLVDPARVTSKIRTDLQQEGIRDAMVAPLRGSDGVIGIFQVNNRLQENSTFSSDDAKLFETLANHAGTSVENARLVARLEESLAHLTEMNRLKDDFVASVSHELRTPLTSIKGFVHTLLRPDTNFTQDQQRDFLATVARQADRLQRLIEDLLVVSRIETAVTPAGMSSISIPSLLRNILNELTERVEHHPVDFVLDPDVPNIRTDEGKLHQIIVNLVDNAMKYSAPGSPVTIGAKRDADGVLITVKDQGSGIPPEQQGRIFDRFYQVDQTSTRRVGGAGLGLYICRSMAESLDARIWLDHSDEHGSVFALWVPTGSADTQPPAPISGTQQLS